MAGTPFLGKADDVFVRGRIETFYITHERSPGEIYRRNCSEIVRIAIGTEFGVSKLGLSCFVALCWASNPNRFRRIRDITDPDTRIRLKSVILTFDM